MDSVESILKYQKDFFSTNTTKSYTFRLKQLEKLKLSILKNEDKILKALNYDLHKSKSEGYLSEIAVVLNAIDYASKNLKHWINPKKVFTPLVHQPAFSYIIHEPYGIVLIIAPWNYPFQLLFLPLVGAIVAGNCAVLKPSEISINTSLISKQIIKETFEDNYITLIQGGIEETSVLLKQKFDYVFFTGSVSVGKIVMKAAAEHLIPLTLELGGKSPCIIDKNIATLISARRIIWGKFLNAGQTCIAPDYLLIHKEIKADFVKVLKQVIKEFYGQNPEESKNLGRIINETNFNRLKKLLNFGKIIEGGNFNPNSLYIAPTIIDEVSWDDAIMKEEIFGPILPILEFSNLDEAINLVKKNPKPLALYVFSKDKEFCQKVINNTSSGGVCINDIISHVVTEHMPFGGIGDSGMGKYHGFFSFETFSHKKSVMEKSFIFDSSLRYKSEAISIDFLKKLVKWMF